MNLLKNKYAKLEEQINNNPIKKAITFEKLYDVAISIANKGEVPTLKMLKHVYEAYEIQDAEIAGELMKILKDSIIRENGDIPASIYIPTKAQQIIENAYFTMVANSKEPDPQKTMDQFSKKAVTIYDYDENNPDTFFDRQ